MRTITLKPILIFVCSVICALYLWGYNYPATAKKIASQLLASECKTDITWVKQGNNHWQSDTGITLKLYRDPSYDQVPSTRFWDGKWTPLGNPLQNLAEAYTLLAAAPQGQEINVTQKIRRIVNPWDIIGLPLSNPDQPRCIPGGFDGICQSSPYRIHYLQRHGDLWAIDRLFVHAQGIFNREQEFQRIYVMEHGPFLPIFEGRFRQVSVPPPSVTFWFSTYNPAIHRGLSDSDMQSKAPSTPEMRLTTWQAINSFFTACIEVAHLS